MIKEINTLENIDIRNVWNNEASDFTPWLAADLGMS